MLKENILKELEKGQTLSGQRLADEFGVSRNAVWKAVNALKAEGYVISGTSRVGYTLELDDVLSPETLYEDWENYSAAFGKANTEIPEAVCLFETDSTNNEAKRRIAAGGKTCIITSETQTEGRGRMGRNFFSPKSSGAYFSVVIQGERDYSSALKFTSLAAVAVCKAIENLAGKHPLIKWVNDVYLNDKKICGILTESITDMESGKVTAVIAGIGINITTAAFPSGVEAGCIGSKDLRRSELISAVTYEIFSAAQEIERGLHLEYYRAHDYLAGKRIKYVKGGEPLFGTACGIDENGGLIVENEGKRTVISSGEVTVRTV